VATPSASSVSRLFLSPPDVGVAERDAVVAAVESGWVAPAGPDLDAFEAEVAAVAGRGHAVGLASGTAAIRLLLREAGVGAGDTVLCSTFTFIGSIVGAVQLGATPVFVDCDASWNVSPALLAEAVARHRPKAAIVVDLYGRAADLPAIVPVLDEAGVVLVEDAAEAVGAAVDGTPAGGFGPAAVFSFNGNKLVTTSGGGAVVTDDAAVAARIRHLATQAREPAPHYEHVEVGSNDRLSNVLAAIGRAQLATLAERIARRQAIRRRYETGLGDLPGIEWNPVDDERFTVNHWLTCITVDPAAGQTPEALRLALEAHDIESRPTWKPMHLQPVFADAPAVVDGTSEAVFASGLCLPSGGSMAPAEQDRVIEIVREAWER
jgi:dTDP-4-amino-4,6-dideoxygalactose transaminase